MAASRLALAKGDPKSSVQDYLVEKWFYDYADNIEAVNIHYACTPLGQVPDWNRQRTTRFLPLVETRIRRKLLKLPARILDTDSGELRDQYLLHHCYMDIEAVIVIVIVMLDELMYCYYYYHCADVVHDAVQ